MVKLIEQFMCEDVDEKIFGSLDFLK